MHKLEQKIVVTGGGSGGHVGTALAFINETKKKYPNALEQILYIGGNLPMEGEKDKKSIEEKLLEKTQINYKIIRAGKLQRYFNLNSIILLLKTIGGLIDSFKILKKFEPDFIFSTGGYVSVPVCISAWILKIPIYIHEQTINIGLANKISSKFAEKIFITFPQSHKYFKREKTIHTGNILKEEILNPNMQGEIKDVVEEMKKGNQPIIYISGGSQGSHTINRTIKDMLPYLIQDYQVIIQTGDNSIYKDYDSIVKERMKLSTKIQKKLYPVKYINSNEIGYIYKNMDLFIGRAGANTVYELGLLQKPCILIPIPWVGKNEQFENAKILKTLGLAKIIAEGELIPDSLFDEINRWTKKNIDIDKELVEKIFTKNAIEKIFKEIKL